MSKEDCVFLKEFKLFFKWIHIIYDRKDYDVETVEESVQTIRKFHKDKSLKLILNPL